MATVETSGVLRNRFRLIVTSGFDPEGFIHDESRMPDKAVDLGTAVIAGSVWDADNRAAERHFHIQETSGWMDSISGTLELSDYKSHLTPGIAVFQAGIGDNADCLLSGIEVADANTWRPIVDTGVFFDLETQLYLHSSGSIEAIVSGLDLRTQLAIIPQAPHPITLSTFFMDKWGKAHAFEQFARKVRFTAWSGLNQTLETLESVPNSSPPLYRPAYSGIRWHNVDTTKFEFMVDHEIPEIIRSRNITSGVHAILRTVPYSRDQYQLPLVPVVSISGRPTIDVFSEYLEFDSTGLATLKLEGLGTVSGLVITSGGYVRLSGTLQPSGNFIQTETSVTTWSGIGTILIEDMIDQRTEQIDYIVASSSGFWTATPRHSGIQHRDQSQIRFVLSGYDLSEIHPFQVSGTFISGSTYTGQHFVNYTILMDDVPPFDQYTGLMTISGTELTPRADLDLTYYRGIALCYEPSGLAEYTSRPAINMNPLVQGNVDGILWFSTFPVKADKITVTASKNRDTDNIIGPVFAGNDFLTLTAKVTDRFGAPVPNEAVSVALSNVQSIGKIDGVSPLDETVVKETNSRGEARFVYTPPETIHGLGYFTPFSNIVNGSGLQFGQTFDIKEIFVSGQWTNLTFAVWNNDLYDVYSEVSGTLTYTADGRFEIITQVIGGSLGTYAVFSPIEPTVALDSNGAILSTSGQVKTLVYTSGQLPGSETEIGAFFVSAEKQATVGIIAPNSKATSKTLKIKVAIPSFMKGELFFGPLEHVDTRSLDSLAYLTINPYTMGFIDESRFDPRKLGNVFRIEGSVSDEFIRHKFYLAPDWLALDNTPNSNEVRKQFSWRNRFILEVD